MEWVFPWASPTRDVITDQNPKCRYVGPGDHLPHLCSPSGRSPHMSLVSSLETSVALVCLDAQVHSWSSSPPFVSSYPPESHGLGSPGHLPCPGHLSCDSCCHQHFLWAPWMLLIPLPLFLGKNGSYLAKLPPPPIQGLSAAPGTVQRNVRPGLSHLGALSPLPRHPCRVTTTEPPSLPPLPLASVSHTSTEPRSRAGSFLYPLDVLTFQDRV